MKEYRNATEGMGKELLLKMQPTHVWLLDLN